MWGPHILKVHDIKKCMLCTISTQVSMGLNMLFLTIFLPVVSLLSISFYLLALHIYVSYFKYVFKGAMHINKIY